MKLSVKITINVYFFWSTFSFSISYRKFDWFILGDYRFLHCDYKICTVITNFPTGSTDFCIVITNVLHCDYIFLSCDYKILHWCLWSTVLIRIHHSGETFSFILSCTIKIIKQIRRNILTWNNIFILLNEVRRNLIRFTTR